MLAATCTRTVAVTCTSARAAYRSAMRVAWAASREAYAAMVAWAVADRHPDRLASLTVLSRPHPSAFRDSMESDADGQRHRSRHHRAFADPNTGPLLLEDGARRLRRNLVDSGVPLDAVDGYLSVVGSPEAMEAALAWYRATVLITQAAGPRSGVS